MKYTLEIVKKALQDANHALVNDESAVKEIFDTVSQFENGKRPHWIYDSVSGKRLGMSQKVVFEKRLEAHNGDILDMFATYKGRDTRPKVEKAEKPVKSSKRTYKRKEKGKEDATKLTGLAVVMETLATDKNGDPIEQRTTVTERGVLRSTETVRFATSDSAQ